MHDLGSPVANSLIGPGIWDLRNSVSDLSRRVTPPVLRPTPSSSVPPPPPNPTSGRPNCPSAQPLAIVPQDTSHQTAAPPPSRSYADVIHGGTSEFDQAIAANAAARRGKGKGKGSPLATTASKAAAVVEAASSKGPPPLTSAAMRFYAPRNSPAPHPERDLIRIRWPDLAASILWEAISGLPDSFKVFINNNGTVSLTVIYTSVPAASYAPFFDALTHKLNQSFPFGNNLWLPFRLAPTDLQFAIHGLPIKAYPEDDSAICDLLQTFTFNAQSVLITEAHFLHPDREYCLRDKKAFSVMVQVPADDGKTLADLSKIPILGSNFVIARAYPSSPSKQCNNCWRFGHVKPRCKNPTVCPLCAGSHTKAEHHYPNSTCLKGGTLKPVLNCCIASPARCPNCSEDHSAGYRDCPAHPGRTLVMAPAPLKRGQPPRPPSPDIHLSSPLDNCFPLIQTLWIPNRTNQDPPFRPLHPTPPGLDSPPEFATPRAPLRPALMGPSGSATRTGRPQPEGEPSPSPAPRDSSASRR